jgi:hypothetical protein
MIHALLLLLATATAAETGYVWPLKLEPALTSSFAEYRPGRFHAGIDLRTGGIGREVFAAGEGYVSRVRCSPYGYGKAVYLQLADGNSAVYAHLSGYYPELAEFVRAEQHRAKAYTIDVTLRPGQFPIQRGQLVALSGQTGIGAPHLHYELRNASEEPINPRLLGVDWPDSTPPQIRKILVAPKGLEGRANGDVLPVVLDVARNEQGDYRTAPVRLSGVVGFGADVLDPGAGGYNLGVHQLRLLAGGTEAFRMQHDLMSYSNHKNAAVSYHPQMRDDGRFLVLWRWPGNRCDSYGHSPKDGWVTVSTEDSEFVMEAVDFLGNRVAVTIPVLFDDGPSTEAITGSGFEISPFGPDLLVSARIAQADGALPKLLVNGAEGTDLSEIRSGLYRSLFAPRSSGRYTLKVRHAALDAAPLEVAAWVQGGPTKTIELGDVRITAGPDAPYGTLILRAWALDTPPDHPMPARSSAFEIWPDSAVLFEDATVSFPLHAGVEPSKNIHIYRHKGDSWSREDTKNEAGRVSFQMDTPGVFMAMEDREGPSFANVSPMEGYKAQTRRPEIRANVSDAGSGIDTFTIHCGEQWLLTAYDPEHNEIRWEQDEDLPSGPQTITLTLSDAAGNTRSYERKLLIP